MKLTDIADTGKAGNGHRHASKAVGAARHSQPDPERGSLVKAIRDSLIYAAIVITVPVAGKPLEALETFADFIRGLRLPKSFAGWAIIGHDESNMLVCRILFKAVGSFTAASIDHPGLQSQPPAIEFCDDFVDVQERFVKRIGKFCDDAICIAVAGGGGGMIPLWVPLIYVPR